MAGNYGGGYYRRPILPPQREQKGYDRDTEIVIPVVQAAIVAWLCDIVGGLLLYLVVYIGPATISTLLGGIILVITALVVGFTRIGYQVKAPAVTAGVLVFAIQQYAFVKLAAVWPWHWRDPLQMWNNWVHTLWLGPLVGGGVLIWRFIREIFDPFSPRIKAFPEEPKRERQPRLADRKLVITKRVNDQEWQEAEEPELEEVWIPPKRGHTLQAHLKSFLVACSRRGTSRAAWLSKGEKYRLTTGKRVTRGIYDECMQILREIGVFTWGGPGTAIEWTCEPREAIAIIEEKIDE